MRYKTVYFESVVDDEQLNSLADHGWRIKAVLCYQRTQGYRTFNMFVVVLEMARRGEADV